MGEEGHVIFNLHLGVGHSVLCRMEEVGHVFFNHILQCSGSPPPPPLSPPPFPALFHQSLTAENQTFLIQIG